MAAKIKKNKAQKRKDKASVALESARQMFDSYYGSVYGERWPKLTEALMKPISHCALWNFFATSSDGDKSCAAVRTELATRNAVRVFMDTRLECFFLPPVADGHNFPHPPKCEETGRTCYYPMDAASLLPVIALGIEEGDHVLDMCAAPGGKSIALAMRLNLVPRALGQLHCNDVSNDRRRRLRQVIDAYLPPSAVGECVRVTGHDCTAWRRGDGEAYDKILLDAPCSTERHLMHKPDEMAQWTPNRPRQNALRQLKLLIAGLNGLQPGGRMVYSTCSLSPMENDDVVEKAVRKMKGGATVVPPPGPLPFGEPTKAGWIVLPDANSAGWGPLYLAVIERREPEEHEGRLAADAAAAGARGAAEEESEEEEDGSDGGDGGGDGGD